VIGLLARRLGEVPAQGRAARDGRLGCVQRLGADLADVVHPHQGAGFPALGVAERRGRFFGGGDRACRGHACKNGAQGRVGGGQKVVERAVHGVLGPARRTGLRASIAFRIAVWQTLHLPVLQRCNETRRTVDILAELLCPGTAGLVQ